MMHREPGQRDRFWLPRRIGVWVGGAIVAAGVLVSCESKPLRTESEIVDDFAQRVLDGLEFGLSGRVEADTWDPETRMFTGVRIDGGPDQIATAQRAELIVDHSQNAVVLRIHGVVYADSESGQVVSREILVTDPIKLNERFVPGERGAVAPIGTAAHTDR